MLLPSVTRTPTASGWIEFARAPVPLRLAGLVAGRCGNAERARHDVDRLLPASTLVPLVISWGSPQHVTEAGGGTGSGLHTSLAAGLRPGPTRTRFRGEQGSVQVYLTPLGASRLLAVPGPELANCVRPLADVAPSLARLSGRLAETSSWSARLALVDRALLDLAASSTEGDPTAHRIWRTLRGSHGTARIEDVLTGTGRSARTATARFVAEIGLPPKTAARLLRFEHAARAVGAGRALAEVAARSGYADQSHLTREFRALAGVTPGSWAAAPPPSPQAALGSTGSAQMVATVAAATTPTLTAANDATATAR